MPEGTHCTLHTSQMGEGKAYLRHSNHAVTVELKYGVIKLERGDVLIFSLSFSSFIFYFSPSELGSAGCYIGKEDPAELNMTCTRSHKAYALILFHLNIENFSVIPFHLSHWVTSHIYMFSHIYT